MSGFEDVPLWKKSLGSGRKKDARARSRLHEAFHRVREQAKQLGAQIAQDLPEFTVHDITHLDALWGLADLIGGDAVSLTPAEAFVLGCAFLTHDLGMGLAAYPAGPQALRADPRWADTVYLLLKKQLDRHPTPAELAAPGPQIETEATASVLRALHAERAEELALVEWKDRPQDTAYHLIEDVELRNAYGRLIGQIAASHGRSCAELPRLFPSTPLGAPGFLPGDWTVDHLKLACLLRLADAAHLDTRRAPGFLRALRRPSGFSKQHWIFQEHLVQPQRPEDRLVFTTGRPFPPEDADAWWLCRETLQLVDRELRQVDALLGDLGRPRLAARGVAGVDDVERLVKCIPADRWLPVDVRLQVTDVLGLVRRLGGRELYGDNPTVPLRELMQNASDAVRARRLVEPDRSADWGDIVVRHGREPDGRHWIEVEDNGVGMSAELISRYLLNFGTTYWESPLMRDELPGLLSRGFQATGRYGIGFFSSFMWGDRVKVTTRRFERAQQETLVLEFPGGLASRPLLRQATANEVLRDGGTRVRVTLDRAPDEPGALLAPNSEYTWMHERRWTLPGLCACLCPGLDVRVTVELLDPPGRWTVHAPDSMQSQRVEFLLRTWHVDLYDAASVADAKTRDDPDAPSAWEKAERLAPRLRPLRDPQGQLAGLACIGWGGSRGMEVAGLVTVGGFATPGQYPRENQVGYIAGVLFGTPLRAARDRALLAVGPDELARWATEQAGLVQGAPDLAERLALAAGIVHFLGGETGPLPIARVAEGELSVGDVLGWAAQRDEVRLEVEDLLNLSARNLPQLGVLYTRFTVEHPAEMLLDWPVRWGAEPHSPTSIIDPRSRAGLIAAVVARAWAVSLDALLAACEFHSDPPWSLRTWAILRRPAVH
jgi:hypothetical protein